jgi:hypothetical protein
MWALMSPVNRSSNGNGTAAAAAAAGEGSHGGSFMQSLYQQPMQLPGAAAAAAEMSNGQQQRPYIAVPFHIDCFLPEFLVSAAAYEAGVRYSWLPGDRFRTYNGPQQQHQVRWYTLLS